MTKEFEEFLEALRFLREKITMVAREQAESVRQLQDAADGLETLVKGMEGDRGPADNEATQAVEPE